MSKRLNTRDEIIQIFITEEEMLDARDACKNPSISALRNFIQGEFARHGYTVVDWKKIRNKPQAFQLPGQNVVRGFLVSGPKGAIVAV